MSYRQSEVIIVANGQKPNWFESNILSIDITNLAGYVMGGIALIVMLIACFFGPDSHWIQVLLLVFGTLLGWIVGIMATPFNDKEKSQFSTYATAISTFFSGFVVAKLDKLFESGVEKGLINDTTLMRGLIFGGSFLLGVLCTFGARMYVAKK